MEDKESDSAEGRFTSPNGQDSDNRCQGEANNKKRSFSSVDENEALKAEIEALRAKTAKLEERNNELLARVGLLEAQKLVSIREDDEYGEQHGNGSSITISAITRGHARVLEKRLRRGADPNQKDKYGTPCLFLAANLGQPECTRLLIKAGADVGIPDDDSFTAFTLFWAIVRGFNDAEGPRKDFVLTADILIDAGAAIRVPRNDRTVGDLLNEETDELDCEAIISVLERRYWQHYGNRNPFLRASTAAETARLLMLGAANGNGGSNRDEQHVNMTRVRSIAPNLRRDTFEALHQVLNEQKSFVSILLTTTRRPMGQSPFALLSGNETTVLPVIADFLGVRGRVLRNVREAARILQNIIINGDREFEFNIDRS